DAARRLERDSGLAHRPVSEHGDRMVGADPFAEELWRLHQARALPGRLRLAPPRTHLSERDPQGLRWYLLIAIAVGLVLARGDPRCHAGDHLGEKAQRHGPEGHAVLIQGQ